MYEFLTAHVVVEKKAIAKAVNELAPRFKKNPGGYVRVTKTNKRRVDKAQMATIEYNDNYLQIYEENDRQKRKQASGTPTFWDWEQKILEQEREFLLRKIEEFQGMLDIIDSDQSNFIFQTFLLQNQHLSQLLKMLRSQLNQQ